MIEHQDEQRDEAQLACKTTSKQTESRLTLAGLLAAITLSTRKDCIRGENACFSRALPVAFQHSRHASLHQRGCMGNN